MSHHWLISCIKKYTRQFLMGARLMPLAVQESRMVVLLMSRKRPTQIRLVMRYSRLTGKTQIPFRQSRRSIISACLRYLRHAGQPVVLPSMASSAQTMFRRLFRIVLIPHPFGMHLPAETGYLTRRFQHVMGRFFVSGAENNLMAL